MTWTCSWYPSNHLSSTRLQRNNFIFSKTSWRNLARRLEDVLKRTSKHLGRRKIVTLMTFRRLEECLEVVFKTCLVDLLKTCFEDVLKTSWRLHGDKQSTYWEYLYLTNLNVYLTKIYFTNLYLAILRWIQNALIRTHYFNICLIWELKQHLCFKN